MVSTQPIARQRTYLPLRLPPGARGFVGGVREDLSGYRLANAPEFSLNGNITYSFPIGANFDADLSALVYYSDEYDMTPVRQALLVSISRIV